MSDQRYLAAILFSDIHQFTIKMGRNEDLMMRLLQQHNHLFKKMVAKYAGRIVKSTGDGFLITFHGGSEALRCALEVQRELTAMNQDKDESEQFLVRIGIHIGEVIERGGDVFGANVNVAARIEPKAEPGGIAISRDLYNTIKASIQFSCESMGMLELKHVAEPLEILKIPVNEQVFSSFLQPREAELDEGGESGFRSARSKLKPESLRPEQVAVFPFKLLTSRKDSAHLSECFAEAVIFGLSAEKTLKVFPLETILNLASANRAAEEICYSLGAGFSVQGSIQKAGSRLKVNVTLIRTVDRKTLHTEALSCAEEEIFEVQKNLVRNILYKIILRISDDVAANLALTAPKSPLAGSFYLKGISEARKAVTLQDHKNAISLLERAVKFDGGFIPAKAALARAYLKVQGQWDSDAGWIEKARREAESALEMNPDSPDANLAMGEVCFHHNELDAAEVCFMQALNLLPDSLDARIALSEVFIRQGKLAEVRVTLEEALELSLAYANRIHQWNVKNRLGRLKMHQGFFLDALDEFGEALNIAKELALPYLLSGVRLNLGHLYGRMGNLTLAESNYLQSRGEFSKMNERRSVGLTLNSLGSVYEKQGKLDEALTALTESGEIAESVGDRATAASVLTNKGRLLNNLGRNDEAVAALTRAIELWHERGEPMREAKALNNLAAAYFDMGDMIEAEATYEKTRALCLETGDYPLLGPVLLNLGEIREFRKEYPQALKAYNEADGVFARVDQGAYHLYLHLFRGRLLFLMGRQPEALVEFDTLTKTEQVHPTVAYRSAVYAHCCRVTAGMEALRLEVGASAISALEAIGSIPELVETCRIWGLFLKGFPERLEAAKACLRRGLELAEKAGMKWEAGLLREGLG